MSIIRAGFEKAAREQTIQKGLRAGGERVALVDITVDKNNVTVSFAGPDDAEGNETFYDVVVPRNVSGEAEVRFGSQDPSTFMMAGNAMIFFDGDRHTSRVTKGSNMEQPYAEKVRLIRAAMETPEFKEPQNPVAKGLLGIVKLGALAGALFAVGKVVMDVASAAPSSTDIVSGGLTSVGFLADAAGPCANAAKVVLVTLPLLQTAWLVHKDVVQKRKPAAVRSRTAPSNGPRI